MRAAGRMPVGLPGRARGARGAGRPAALLAVAAAVAAALVAGCGGIPDDGPVVSGERLRQEDPGAALLVIPQSPEPGAAPEQIVSGFIAAMAQVDDAEFGVAREYLTTAAARQWAPRTRILVYSGAVQAEPVVEGRTSVGVTVTAEISEAGRYTPRRIDSEQVPFTLGRERGEWRITDVDDQVLVSEADAERVLRPYPVLFADRLDEYLVPDVRWFPAQPASARALAQAVLDGPSAPLSGSVHVVEGDGLALSDDGVTVSGTIATVDLTEAYLRLEAEEAALLRLQLERTLTALPEVGEVRLSVEGTPTDGPAAELAPFRETSAPSQPYVLLSPEAAPGAGDAPAPDAPAGEAEAGPDAGPDPGPDAGPDAVVPAPGEQAAPSERVVAQLSQEGVPDLVDGSGEIASRIVRGLAVSTPPVADTGGGGQPAVVAGVGDADDGGDGVDAIWVRTGSGPPRSVVSGVELTPPSFDSWGWLWTASQGEAPQGADPGAPAQVAVHAVNGRRQVRVDLEGLLEPGERIRVLRVSRDGSRAVLVLERADRSSARVGVWGIVRDPDGSPTNLSGASHFPLVPDLTSVADATWVSPDTVAVLGSVGPPGELRPHLAQVGGTGTELPTVASAQTIAAGDGERTIVVGRGDGTLVRRVGNAWSPEPQRGWFPTY